MRRRTVVTVLCVVVLCVAYQAHGIRLRHIRSDFDAAMSAADDVVREAQNELKMLHHHGRVSDSTNSAPRFQEYGGSTPEYGGETRVDPTTEAAEEEAKEAKEQEEKDEKQIQQLKQDEKKAQAVENAAKNLEGNDNGSNAAPTVSENGKRMVKAVVEGEEDHCHAEKAEKTCCEHETSTCCKGVCGEDQQHEVVVDTDTEAPQQVEDVKPDIARRSLVKPGKLDPKKKLITPQYLVDPVVEDVPTPEQEAEQQKQQQQQQQKQQQQQQQQVQQQKQEPVVAPPEVVAAENSTSAPLNDTAAEEQAMEEREKLLVAPASSAGTPTSATAALPGPIQEQLEHTPSPRTPRDIDPLFDESIYDQAESLINQWEQGVLAD